MSTTLNTNNCAILANDIHSSVTDHELVIGADDKLYESIALLAGKVCTGCQLKGACNSDIILNLPAKILTITSNLVFNP